MKLNYYVVDAFATKAFEGNPAGIIVLDEWLPEELMLKIAIENNLSETAFTVKKAESPCTYELRWFTPGGEIDLCGHATIGTASILFQFNEQNKEEIQFHALKCGHHLNVSRRGELLTMDFPSVPPEPYYYQDYMGDALGAVPAEVLKTDRDLMLVYDSAETIRNMQPDFTKIKQFPVGLSVYVTARSDNPEYDIVCRAFWPKLNIDEDPVCGSMHTTLVPYWCDKLGKNILVSRQVSTRGGTLYCSLDKDRVKLSGTSRLYLTGEIDIG